MRKVRRYEILDQMGGIVHSDAPTRLLLHDFEKMVLIHSSTNQLCLHS